MEIILKPILTEKMSALTDKEHKVAFVVAKDANKIEIKKAVEEMYGAGVITGRTASFKKAIVTLAEGDSIDFFSNI